MNLQEMSKIAQQYEEERKRNFANPPKDCKHELVYHKINDDVHCHYCDKYLYDASKD